MPTYYVDHAGSATDPYDTQAKAQTSINALLAAKTLTGGDILYLCDNGGIGETIAVEIDINASGSNASGYIKIIGCNSSGVVDGTRYVIDCNNAGINGIDLVGNDWLWFQNIEVKNTGTGTKSCWYTSTGAANYCTFINCCAQTSSGYGFNLNASGLNFLLCCVSYSHTYEGFYLGAGNNLLLFCCSRDNSRHGFGSMSSTDIAIGCIAYHNTSDGYNNVPRLIMNCIADSNDNYGINIVAGSGASAHLIANRITDTKGSHTAAGIDCNAEPTIIGWNYFDEDVGAAEADAIIDDAIAQVIQADATFGNPGYGTTDTNLYEQDDANDGYVDADATPDFSTGYTSATDPVHRRLAIVIPWN